MLIFTGGLLKTQYAPDLKLNILESYFYIGKRKLEIDRNYCKDFFLDSGAFSAWSKGKHIDINSYISFIKKNKDQIDHYANLDEIGNPEKSQQNLLKMEAEGLNPIPVYHYGEDFSVFKKMCEKYDFIALGGMVTISTKNREAWLDQIFDYACNEDGTTDKKFHGFGMTTFDLLKKYPWFSVDSVSPVMTAAMGGIFFEEGQTLDLSREKTTPVALQKYLEGGSYINSKGEEIQIKRKESMEGFTFDQMKNDYKVRMIINLRYVMNLEKELTENPPIFKRNDQISLF